MEWLNIHVSVLRSPEFIGSDPVERATWLCVLGYSVEQENGGRIVGAALWKDRQWQQACGVTAKEVRGADRLLRIDGADILVNGYPTAKESQVRQARSVAYAGAMARWGKNADGSNADRHAGKMPTGIADGNAEGKGREQEGKGREGEGEARTPEDDHIGTPPPPGSIPEAASQDRWHLERREPWAQSLTRAGCKLGPNNWPQWKALVDEHGTHAIELAARRVAASERWADRIEEALAPRESDGKPEAKEVRAQYPDELKWISVEMVASMLKSFGQSEVLAVCRIAKQNGIVFDSDEWGHAFNGRPSTYGGWDFWEPRKRLGEVAV